MTVTVLLNAIAAGSSMSISTAEVAGEFQQAKCEDCFGVR